MKRLFGKFVYFIFGWKLVTSADMQKVKKSVMLAAPHTSNWDFLFAISGFWIMGLDVRYFIKDTYTKSLFGFVFKWTGAMGVDRSARNNLVEHSIETLNKHEQMVILVPAEGTRKYVEKWKKGFYHIALGANVPVSLGYLDYKEKIGGVLDVFDLSGVEEDDFNFIQEKYRPIHPKHPENYNPQIH